MIRKKVITRIFIALILTTVFFYVPLKAQVEMGIRVMKKENNKSEGTLCFTLELTTNKKSIRLASQNYRLFYNSSNLKFDETSLVLKEELNDYQVRLVQHLNHIDATGTGELPFESDLGFLNFSLVLEDFRKGGVSISTGSYWTKVAELCFEVVSHEVPIYLMLARDELTSKYGRAFIELSIMDADNNVHAAPISSYIDYIHDL